MSRHDRPLRTHQPVVDDELTDPLTKKQWCFCGLPVVHRRHTLPERDDEEREHEARKVGER